MVSTAVDGEEAIESAAKLQLDVVLLALRPAAEGQHGHADPVAHTVLAGPVQQDARNSWKAQQSSADVARRRKVKVGALGRDAALDVSELSYAAFGAQLAGAVRA
ncbi:hypothetical protein [Cupriavidus sp. D39]|uniref:hypothetical protein n=1 Tax=Cupriavidus sp. D39 TaxID=2997877 RepID=UPI0022701C2B|nr:hypothetical protein [Cupriavidus sp. D39]MCY0853333.1 hypothetical protein [Cupriavidus sp. D39]